MPPPFSIEHLQVVNALSAQQVVQLHHLFQQEWWSETRTLEDTQRCVAGSQLCIGLIEPQGQLVGFARVLTDGTFKAFIFDLIVQQNWRAQGLGKHLLGLIKAHEKLSLVQHFELYCLPEMFAFYTALGFTTEVGGVQLMRYSAAR
jgi:predicted GNAT family N-acyltransferase